MLRHFTGLKTYTCHLVTVRSYNKNDVDQKWEIVTSQWITPFYHFCAAKASFTFPVKSNPGAHKVRTRLSQALILRVTDMFVYCNYSVTKNYFCDDLLMLNVGPSIKQSIHYLLLFPVKYMNTFTLFYLHNAYPQFSFNLTRSLSFANISMSVYCINAEFIFLQLFTAALPLSTCFCVTVHVGFLRVRQGPCRKCLEFSFFSIIINFLHTKTLIKAKARTGCGFKDLLRLKPPNLR